MYCLILWNSVLWIDLYIKLRGWRIILCRLPQATRQRINVLLNCIGSQSSFLFFLYWLQELFWKYLYFLVMYVRFAYFLTASKHACILLSAFNINHLIYTWSPELHKFHFLEVIWIAESEDDVQPMHFCKLGQHQEHNFLEFYLNFLQQNWPKLIIRGFLDSLILYLTAATS